MFVSYIRSSKWKTKQTFIDGIMIRGFLFPLLFFSPPGPSLNIKTVFFNFAMTRRPWDRLIFIVWIPILVRQHMYIKTGDPVVVLFSFPLFSSLTIFMLSLHTENNDDRTVAEMPPWIYVIIYNRTYDFDNFWCSRWWKFLHNVITMTMIWQNFLF